MNQTIEDCLNRLGSEGNLRRLPDDTAGAGMLDFTSNDYLGLARDAALQKEFLASLASGGFVMGASASRLLSAHQEEYARLEATIAGAYGPGSTALLMNSGYHANTGIIPALCSANTFIIADRLVHASIIDGIRLSGKPFARFHHNDINHLESIAAKAVTEGKEPLVIVESVYSMDGDSPAIGELVELKKRYPAISLYVDEAHAIGVCGPEGLGLARDFREDVDVIIGTFGKALASVGAYAVVSPRLREYLVNTSRSFIFSTALPPLSILWSTMVFGKMRTMEAERRHLALLSSALAQVLGPTASHIQCLMVGNPHAAMELSGRLRAQGVLALPIRHPTVPPGTDRLRVSLSAAHSADDINTLISLVQ